MPVPARKVSVLLACALVALTAFSEVKSQAQFQPSATGLCGPLNAPGQRGPFDYRTTTAEDRSIVERFHFTPKVESLQSGESGPLGSDLDFTLRAFPNHPRALYAMMRLGERTGSSRPQGARYPVECYFERAIRFQPDDAQARVLYALFLLQGKRQREARQQLSAAEATDPTDPQVLYNIGLAYLEAGEPEKALAFAHRAYAQGVAFPGLRDRLKRGGHWREPGASPQPGKK